jgi:hypothetical protein
MNPYASPLTRTDASPLGWSMAVLLPVVFVVLAAVTYPQATALYKHGYEVISVIPEVIPAISWRE